VNPGKPCQFAKGGGQRQVTRKIKFDLQGTKGKRNKPGKRGKKSRTKITFNSSGVKKTRRGRVDPCWEESGPNLPFKPFPKKIR